MSRVTRGRRSRREDRAEGGDGLIVASVSDVSPQPTDASPAEAPAPSWTGYVTAISVAIAAVALVATVWSVGPRALLAQIADIGVGFAVVIAIEIAITAADSAALSGFLGAGGRRPSYLQVLHAQVTGRAVNAVTPLAALGEATKATALMTRTAPQRAIAAVIRYNLASVGLRLTSVAIGAPLVALVVPLPTGLRVVLLVGGGLAAVGIGLGMLLVRRGMMQTAIGLLRGARLVSSARAARWRAKLVTLDRALRSRPDESRRERWAPVAWIALSWLLSLVSMWTILVSVGYLTGPGTLAAIAIGGTLITFAASIVPMGLGISEGSNAALFAALGAPPAVGVAMVVGGRVVPLCYAAIGLVLIGTSTAVGRARTHRRGARAHARAAT